MKKLSWLDINKKYIARWEATGTKITQGGVRRAIESDLDYQLEVTCPRGSIYKYAIDGSTWAVYVKGTKKNLKKISLWSKFDKLCERVQTGDFEAAWKFDAEQMDEVASILKVRKRVKRPKKDKNETIKS